MPTINMLDAKSNLSRLVAAVESGAESEIVIARGGRAAAKLVPIGPPKRGKRIGVAKGKFKAPEPDKELDAEIADLFNGRRRK
jgi:antitoxin (DNA-binding transcriptional repressor) of toxin-antitoxin stability system